MMTSFKLAKQPRLVLAGTALFLALLLNATPNIFAQEQTQRFQFKVTTSAPGGSFAPLNIGAIWVEDADGHFLKTLKVWAEPRRPYLYTWNVVSGGNTTDAVTGPTLTTHHAHAVTWDGLDAKGNLVPNGNYIMRIEITDQHAQGPVGSFEFPIGQPSNRIGFSDEFYFQDIEISWTTSQTGANAKNDAPAEYQLFPNHPNPFNPATEIKYALPQPGHVELNVYNFSGHKVAALVAGNQPAGIHAVEFETANLASGIYLYKITAGSFSQTKKMLLIK